ncbi:MAG: hypothetical protein ACI857_000358 [Arenicella sp.]|jgi:hypothetical protein
MKDKLKVLIIFLLCFSAITISSCTEENTDTSVSQNDNPIGLQVQIDSFPPSLDTLMFNKLALDCFFELGNETNGEFYYKSAEQSIHDVIIDILNEHASSGSDVVLLIDKTGSMANDIDSVKYNMDLILDQLKYVNGVRVAVAVYGDKNVDGADWWSTSELTNDIDLANDYVSAIEVSDGGDYPESVYDGIANVINELDWRKDSKKVILVVGDAPSLEDSLTEYSRSEIIELCNKKGIDANLFPVLISPYKAQDFVDFSFLKTEIMSKIYPNPAVDVINIDLAEAGDYMVSLISMDGLIIHEQYCEELSCRIDIPEGTIPGTYVLRVMAKNTFISQAINVIIQ